MNAGNGTGKAVAEINVTPMIDVLLVLLIIFLLIQPKAPNGLTSQVPQPSKEGAPTLPSTVVVEVLPGAGGGGPIYRINQAAVPRTQVVATLKAVFAPRNDRTMFVKGDASLTFRDVAEAVDMGHQAGVANIGLITPGTERGQ